ncbi:hypothetical protein [Actinomadura flavalba]|uniref:hypothetical protein n=1 Tax=Actinomadura flavalba TaxID=1120938 RepID=UPI000370C5D9|nr:hypothetical protein [Actinomadura flavalba]
MSFIDTLLLILHVGAAIFTLGPLTAATHATPRFIRQKNVSVLRYLNRTVRIYLGGSLGVLLFGLFLAPGRFDEVWLTASMTLFIVTLVLLVLVERDQRKAIQHVEAAAGAKPAEGEAVRGGDVAQVERGRIAAIGGVVSLLWIIVLILMIWQPGA